MSASTGLDRPPQQRECAKVYQFASPALLARNSFVNLASEVWAFLVLIVAMPVLVSRLGKDGFGLFSLAWVVLGYMAILDLGVSRGATKFICEQLARKQWNSIEQFSRTAVAANLILGVLGGAVLVALTPSLADRVFAIPVPYHGEARVIFYTLGTLIPVLLVQAALRGILCSYQQFGWINLLNSIAVTAQWGLSCILAAKSARVDVIVIIAVIVRAIIVIAYAAVVLHINRALLGLSIAGLDPLKRMLCFGGWVSISQLMTPILIYLDRMLIAALLSIGIMTVYVIPYEIVSRLRVIPGSVVATLFPSFSERSSSDNEGILQIYNGAFRYLLIVLLPCFVFLGLLGSDVISIWIGSDYGRQGAIVIEIMAFGALLNSLAHVPYTALQALGRPDIPAKLHLLELPIYLLLSLMFIPAWGIVGAAIAVTIRLIVDSVGLFWSAEKYVHCRITWLDLWRVVCLNLALAVVFWLLQRSVMSPIRHVTAGLLAFAAYLISIWFLALDGRDKPVLLHALRLSGASVS